MNSVQRKSKSLLWLLAITIVITLLGVIRYTNHPEIDGSKWPASTAAYWHAPDSSVMALSDSGDLVAYGRELIAHTARYLGPKGSVMSISNGMNCQNCHLKAGTKIFGNNYGAVASMYPRFRARSGGIESIEKRINDCIQRSLNGQPLPHDSRELKAMITYIRWLGQNVAHGVTPEGTGLVNVPLMDRAADSIRGGIVYRSQCAKCHGRNGQGVKRKDGIEWEFPPLWGENSYNTGAGLFRLSRFAGYVKANMPQGITFESPQLTDEEAWDVAAYVNSMPRPQKTFREDWPDITKKPFDHPFGPYADGFNETQHKYGPFKEMEQ
jgi:thiosulfate dehydrogenase